MFRGVLYLGLIDLLVLVGVVLCRTLVFWCNCVRFWLYAVSVAADGCHICNSLVCFRLQKTMAKN